MHAEQETNIAAMEQQLNVCEADLLFLESLSEKFQIINDNAAKLSSYYHSDQYIKDYEMADKFSKHYEVLNQDSAWNVLADQYQQKIKLLKLLINSIND